jgi:alpha-beta hydrolase superfamily lysophospholipase
VKHDERTITTSDGVDLHVEQWTPDRDVRFVVVISHGNSEHVHRYDRFARVLSGIGGLCFGADYRGQGRSGGKRGHVPSRRTYGDDLRHVMETMRAELPTACDPDAVPWFLFGHSAGGLAAFIYLLDHRDAVPLRGAIISAPFLGLAMKVNPVKLWLGTVVGKVLPTLSVPTGLPADAITRDPEEVERYANDPLRARNVTAWWFNETNANIDRAKAEVPTLELPLLWYSGTGDRVCDHAQSESLFDAMPDPDKHDQTFKAFEGYYHELHNEPPELREPVMAMITGWIEDRL